MNAFSGCTSLTSVTFEGKIDNLGSHFSYDYRNSEFISPFLGDLYDKYSRYRYTIGGGPGKYTTTAPVNEKSVWKRKIF